MSDDDGIQLSPQLLQDMRDTLNKHDGRCSDDVLAMQYLVAAAGMLLSASANAQLNRHDALHELAEFMHHVFDYMEKEKVKRAAPPPSAAMGVWKPGK